VPSILLPEELKPHAPLIYDLQSLREGHRLMFEAFQLIAMLKVKKEALSTA